MRLSDVLSKPSINEYSQIDGFLENKKLSPGVQRKIAIGKIALNFYCRNCNDDRTFCSGDKLSCMGINDNLVSITSALRCSGCDSTVPIWFLVECNESIFSIAPNVRIAKRTEKLPDTVLPCRGRYDDFSGLLEKAERAYHDDLGAGSIVYLRKILERITIQVAEAENINTRNTSGSRRQFKAILEEVDAQRFIIPREFSENGYRLFQELSSVVHGESDEHVGLQKYKPLYRLVVGILDNVKNNTELMRAIGSLGWNSNEET